jgi:hypothetical protein
MRATRVKSPRNPPALSGASMPQQLVYRRGGNRSGHRPCSRCSIPRASCRQKQASPPSSDRFESWTVGQNSLLPQGLWPASVHGAALCAGGICQRFSPPCEVRKTSSVLAHIFPVAKIGSANNGDGVNPLLSTAGLAQRRTNQTIALQSGSPAIAAIPVGILH